jgi:hypothetical protein
VIPFRRELLSDVTYHFKTVSMFPFNKLIKFIKLPVGHVSSSGNEFLTALKCELIVGGLRTPQAVFSSADPIRGL